MSLVGALKHFTFDLMKWFSKNFPTLEAAVRVRVQKLTWAPGIRMCAHCSRIAPLPEAPGLEFAWGPHGSCLGCNSGR